VPYAIGAKFAHPDRPVIAMVGDGAMQMNGMNELLTIARYRDRFVDPRLVVLVLANRDLNQVTWEMRGMEGNPRFATSQDVPALDHARFAELCGLRGIRVDKPEQVGPAWDEALRSDRPVVIDAICDPEVPPLPPHVTLEEARNFTRAVLKGDPGAAAMIRQSFKKKVRELIPT
jgi:pyruvate dehydrogenase (quinone)